MKLLFLTDNFPPEVNAPANRTYEHCKEWVKQGVEVTVITCAPNFPKGKVYDGYKNKLRQVEYMDGIKVIRVWTYITVNEGFVKRILDYISFSIMSFFAGLFLKTDIIVATSPQFFTALSGRWLSFFKRKPWIMEVPDGELGRVVVTRLDTIGMPFVRYYTGDLAVKLPKDRYPQDRELNFPLLERVIGRDTDIVKTKNGGQMIVHFFTAIFQLEPSFQQFKIIQRNLDGIEVEFIPSSNFDVAAKTRIEKRITEELKENISIQWKEVQIIPPTKSGKPQIIESLIK